jgi:hypothetical protein
MQPLGLTAQRFAFEINRLVLLMDFPSLGSTLSDILSFRHDILDSASRT